MSPKDTLRQLMRGAGLSYEETAELLYVSRHTVHAWLKPLKHEPPLAMIELLALKTGQGAEIGIKVRRKRAADAS